jgi:RNA polymerase sigma factor (sigma-70 family)
MAGGQVRAFNEPLEMLFGAGTCAGLSDGQLLSRFVAGRDAAGELAFEALVMRHGPMVLRICDQALDDPNDVHDAVQAVFLVLANRAGAVRNRDSVASWLYGVALRVASRARVTAIRRRIRDRRTNMAAQAAAAMEPRQAEPAPAESDDRAQVLYQEVGRLPEKFRAPIVLCYLEGLTHDEAATRLSWPVGTIRSRLSRGRDALRHRLSRRGVTAPVVVGPLSVWLASEQAASAAAAGTIATSSSGALPTSFSSALVKMVSQVAVTHSPAVSSGNAGTLALAQGVLNMMALKKLIVMASVLVSLSAITIGGGVVWVRTSQAQGSRQEAAKAPASDAPKTDTAAKIVEDVEAVILVQNMLALARRRYDRVRHMYENAQVEYDRVLDAGEQLEKIELNAAKSTVQRREVLERSLSRLKAAEAIADARGKAARGGAADLDEAKLRRMQAELDLKTLANNPSDTASILKRLGDLERKVETLEKKQR